MTAISIGWNSDSQETHNKYVKLLHGGFVVHVRNLKWNIIF